MKGPQILLVLLVLRPKSVLFRCSGRIPSLSLIRHIIVSDLKHVEPVRHRIILLVGIIVLQYFDRDGISRLVNSSQVSKSVRLIILVNSGAYLVRQPRTSMLGGGVQIAQCVEYRSEHLQLKFRIRFMHMFMVLFSFSPNVLHNPIKLGSY